MVLSEARRIVTSVFKKMEITSKLEDALITVDLITLRMTSFNGKTTATSAFRGTVQEII